MDAGCLCQQKRRASKLDPVAVSSSLYPLQTAIELLFQWPFFLIF